MRNTCTHRVAWHFQKTEGLRAVHIQCKRQKPDNKKSLCGSTAGRQLPGRGACISIPPAENKPMSSRPKGIMGRELWCLDCADSMSSCQDEEGGGLKNATVHSAAVHTCSEQLLVWRGNLVMKLRRGEVHRYSKAAKKTHHSKSFKHCNP